MAKKNSIIQSPRVNRQQRETHHHLINLIDPQLLPYTGRSFLLKNNPKKEKEKMLFSPGRLRARAQAPNNWAKRDDPGKETVEGVRQSNNANLDVKRRREGSRRIGLIDQ